MAQSGNITRTPDLVLTGSENITNAKINRAGGGTYRLDANSITDRELSSGLTSGFGRVALLRANALAYVDGSRVIVRGYHTSGDGRVGPDVYVDLTDTTTADDGLSCFVDTLGQRFKRVFTGAIHVEWGGAKGDNTTDDTAAIQACIDHVELNNPTRGGTILLGPYEYLTSAPLIIDQEGVTIQGTGTRFFSTSITCSIMASHANGPVLHIQASSTRLKGFRIDSTAARLPTSSYSTPPALEPYAVVTRDWANPAIGSGATRNDGIHISGASNGMLSMGVRTNYVIKPPPLRLRR